MGNLQLNLKACFDDEPISTIFGDILAFGKLDHYFLQT